jgi:phosphoglycolate phosphatase
VTPAPVPNLVVFDLDGTLVDSVQDLAAATSDALTQFAPGSLPLPAEVVRGFVGDGAAKLIERALAHAGLDLGVSEVLPVFLACYRTRLLESTRAYPGIGEALRQLSGHCTLAVLTNKPGDLARALLAGLGLSSPFAWVLGGGDLPARKPDPAGLLQLVERAGVEAGQAVMVGDSPTDVSTGRAAGTRTLGVLWGLRPEETVAAAPDALCRDPLHLPAALTHLLDNQRPARCRPVLI